MRRNNDGLVIGRVIGDVVDWFVPTVIMTLCFGDNYVTNGCEIKPSLAANVPILTITGHANQLYTLVMTDPDAPSPSEPSMREYVHWIVTDIPGGTNAALGKEILGYIGPNPSLGIHRFTFVLFQQKQALGFLEPPLSRSNFTTRTFAESLGLGSPVATVYFNAQKEPAKKRRKFK